MKVDFLFLGLCLVPWALLPDIMRHIFHWFRCFACLPGKDPRENTGWKLKRGSLFNERRRGKKPLQFHFTSQQEKLALQRAWKPPLVVEHNCYWPCRAADNNEGSILLIFISNMRFEMDRKIGTCWSSRTNTELKCIEAEVQHLCTKSFHYVTHPDSNTDWSWLAWCVMEYHGPFGSWY